jgi:protein-S-isoprenylcysteine O-methyltransferase Ste14
MESDYGYGFWSSVIFNVLFILFFALSFLVPRGRWEWRSLGVFTGFLVALFSEMYGFPLTIYILTSILGSRYPVLNPFSHVNGHLLLVFLGGGAIANAILHIVSNGLMIAGFIIMGIGWKKIHAAQGELVTDEIYSRVRHPQYSGLLLVSVGLIIQWPTLATLLLWPVMFIFYYRLSLREERGMIELFGQRYLQYKKSVPAFCPRVWARKKEPGTIRSCHVSKQEAETRQRENEVYL